MANPLDSSQPLHVVATDQATHTEADQIELFPVWNVTFNKFLDLQGDMIQPKIAVAGCKI